MLTLPCRPIATRQLLFLLTPNEPENDQKISDEVFTAAIHLLTCVYFLATPSIKFNFPLQRQTTLFVNSQSEMLQIII